MVVSFPRAALRHNRTAPGKRRGAVLVLLALFLPVCLILCAFALNIAYLELNRTELQISTDAAARAGGRDLIVSQSTATATARAQSLAKLNPVAGQPLLLQASDLTFGSATRPALTSRYAFTAGGASYNALQVIGHRDAGSQGGQLTLLMPQFSSSKQFGAKQIAQSTEGDIDIALVVDRSGSMAYSAKEITDPLPGAPAAAPKNWTWGMLVPPKARWLDLVAGVTVFISELNNSGGREMLALVSYNNQTQIDCPISTSYAGILPALNVYTSNFSSGSTATGDGITQGVNALANANARSWASKVMVVMTDGLTNTGSDPIVAAKQAAAKNILIFTITYSDEADQTAMAQVAAIGSGKHYHANNSADLNAVFQDIVKQMPVLLCK